MNTPIPSTPELSSNVVLDGDPCQLAELMARATCWYAAYRSEPSESVGVAEARCRLERVLVRLALHNQTLRVEWRSYDPSAICAIELAWQEVTSRVGRVDHDVLDEEDDQ
jgi:hypothetical protein